MQDLSAYPFDPANATKRDVERVVAWINRQPCREWTKHGLKIAVRKLVQYAKYGSCDKRTLMPPEVAWISMRVVERFPEYFLLTTERMTKRKLRTLIKSKFEPLLSRLEETCQLDSEELSILKSFENDFRRAFGIFLDLTLKRDKDYLTRSLNAFEELLNGYA